MKNFSKKIIVTSLSTAMSLGLIGGIAGTIAWYQYNTRATATILGTSVANTGVLQIKTETGDWTRDLVTADLLAGRENVLITPVTFGEMNVDGSLPDKAYKRPDASENPYATNPGSYAEVYQEADKDHDYIQYSVNLKASKVVDAGNLEQVSLPVFLSDIALEDTSGNIAEGLRIHLAVDDNGDGNIERYFFISKHEVKNLSLSGVLDCDGDDEADIIGGYENVANRDKVVVYGNEGEFQSTKAIADVKASRDGNGDIDQYAEANHDKVICYTPTTGAAKITVTLWLEGWDRQVDETEVDTREVLYKEASYVYAQDVTGLFVDDGAGDYELAPADEAVDGTDYFEIYYEPVELELFSEVPANVYSEDAGVYTLEAGEIAVAGKDYYKRHVVDVTAKVHFADVVTGMYTFDGTNYLPITAADTKAVAGTTYYEKVSENEVYTPVVLEDAHGDPLPADTVDVSKYYTLDAGIYKHASGKNQLGVTYYELTTGGKVNVPIWSGENTHGATFMFGLTFDVGKNAFVD